MAKIKIKSRITALVLFTFFLMGCPPKKNIGNPVLICTKATYQPYASGVESVRGNLTTINLKSNINDTIKIEKIFLGEDLYFFENARFKNESLVIYPNDSAVFVNNTIKYKYDSKVGLSEAQKKQAPPIEYEGACLIVYKVGKSMGFFTIPEFTEGPRLMNP